MRSGFQKSKSGVMLAGKAPDYYTRPASRGSSIKRLQILNYRIERVADGMIESSVYFTEHILLTDFISRYPTELPNLCHTILEQLVEQLWLIEHRLKRYYVLSLESIYISINGVVGLSPLGVLNHAGFHNASSRNLQTLQEIIGLLLVKFCPDNPRYDIAETYHKVYNFSQSRDLADFCQLLLSPQPTISQLAYSQLVKNKTTLSCSVLTKICELYDEVFKKWPYKKREYAFPHNLAAYHEEIEVVHLIKQLRVSVTS